MTFYVEEDIDPESWLVRKVYANYGLAMYTAQVLEHGIANLAAYTGVRDGAITSLAAMDADYAELFSKTMGQAKNALLDRRADVTVFEGLLRRAVKLRNFLAHHYFRQRAAAFMTSEGQNEMIRELREAVDFFQDVDAKLQPLTSKILDSLGLSQHLPGATETARSAGFGDPLPGLTSPSGG